MATYKVTGFDLSSPPTDLGTGCDVTKSFTFATSGLATPHKFETGDILKLCKVPKNAVILDYYIYLPDTDSGTSQTLDLGLLTQDDNCFADNSTVGQAVGILDPHIVGTNGLVANALPLTVTADDTFALTCGAAGAGAGAGGTIKGWVRFNMQGGQY